MKKVLSMVAALLLCVGAQAQIVSSRSAIVKTEKQASSTQWFLRAGLNIMNFSGDGAEGADSNIGYNATFGYQKPLGSQHPNSSIKDYFPDTPDLVHIFLTFPFVP